MITLNVQPEVTPLSWEEFKQANPLGYSIALDGYVEGPFQFSPEGPWVNFNHHERVDRLSTRATCAQILITLRQGLEEAFTPPGSSEVKINVFVNDCDEDVCLSWFLLNNPHLSCNSMNPILNRLVMMEDMLDATAGAYPFPRNLPSLTELAWVFEPYRHFRVSGQIDKRNGVAFKSVIKDVENRILRYVTGHGDHIQIDTRYEKIGGGKNWVMVNEIGNQARTGMFSEGIRAYVSARHREDGNWVYSIGRMSVFVNFPIPEIMQSLNEAEQAKCGGLNGDLWGGSPIIGGSPRVRGSLLPPAELTEIINEVMSRTNMSATVY